VTATRARLQDGPLVGIAAILAHGRSIAFDFTYLDDRDFIVDDHAFLSRPAGLLGAFTRSYMHVVDAEHPYYRPLVTLSYALDAQWSGVRAFGYHLTNVVLHATASLLFLALLRRLSLGRVMTRVAALVFAVHPVLASAVAWIPGRNDSLLAVFTLSSWLFFLRQMRGASWLHRVLHVAFFGLALWTKEAAVVIPVVCLAHVALVERSAGRRLLRSPGILALIAGWFAVITCRVVIHPLVATGATLREIARNLPLVAASLGELVVPVNPSLLNVRDHMPLWPGVVVAALVAIASRFVPGVRKRVVALGAAAFLLFLCPTLAVPGDLVLDSRLYLPACGVVIAAAEVVRAVARDRAALFAFSGVTVAALAAITMVYEDTFRDRRAFARSAVAGAPYSALAHFCLGQTYQIDGDADHALSEYRLALTLGPAEAVHNNIAVIHMASARWTEAERELRQELAIDPRYARAYRNLGVVLRRQGRIEEALAADQRASELAADGTTIR
jgi:hypothetical protein